MIAMLEGVVSEKLINSIILNVHGVGYAVYTPIEDYEQLYVDKNARLYIFEYIREQSYDLFGFTKQETKYFFEKLLDVNGVGPKMALSILSIGTQNKVRTAIASGDVKMLQSAQGVGKRVAERIIIELKDKVGVGLGNEATINEILGNELNTQDDAVNALTSLGYTTQDALRVLANVPTDLPVEERVTLALKNKK